MTRARFVSAVLVTALVFAAVPATSWAADDPSATPGLQASIARAVAQLSASPQSRPQMPARPIDRGVRLRRAAGGMGGGAASKAWMAYTIAGVAASLAGTYFVVKEMRKQTNAAQ